MWRYRSPDQPQMPQELDLHGRSKNDADAVHTLLFHGKKQIHQRHAEFRHRGTDCRATGLAECPNKLKRAQSLLSLLLSLEVSGREVG